MAFALMLLFTERQTIPFVVPVLVGLSMGLVGSRFLLFFIKLSHHCQRGTSQSTFFLAWETGIALGLGIGWGDLPVLLNEALQLGSAQKALLLAGLMLIVLAMAMYVCFTHQWYLKHKNR